MQPDEYKYRRISKEKFFNGFRKQISFILDALTSIRLEINQFSVFTDSCCRKLTAST